MYSAIISQITTWFFKEWLSLKMSVANQITIPVIEQLFNQSSFIRLKIDKPQISVWKKSTTVLENNLNLFQSKQPYYPASCFLNNSRAFAIQRTLY